MKLQVSKNIYKSIYVVAQSSIKKKKSQMSLKWKRPSTEGGPNATFKDEIVWVDMRTRLNL